mmetsp:Transcript_135444/g.377256  ORF Transcript_135444/g.377256 Transcript_135444/m.377256 type:complete len:206 (+) Transcript_135444:156-773(+)
MVTVQAERAVAIAVPIAMIPVSLPASLGAHLPRGHAPMVLLFTKPVSTPWPTPRAQGPARRVRSQRARPCGAGPHGATARSAGSGPRAPGGACAAGSLANAQPPRSVSSGSNTCGRGGGATHAEDTSRPEHSSGQQIQELRGHWQPRLHPSCSRTRSRHRRNMHLHATRWNRCPPLRSRTGAGNAARGGGASQHRLPHHEAPQAR